MESSSKGIVAAVLGVVAIVVLLLINPFVVVGAGERGVVLHWGAVEGQVLNEGIHWRTPISQRVVKVSVQVQKEETDADASTKDLQTITAKVALNYHLNPDKVSEIYQHLGLDFKDNIIAPTMQEAIKSATAKYNAEELITNREAVKADIMTSLKDRLESQGILIDNFNIVNFSFSAQFNAAIEAKVTAEQNAQAAKNKLDQVKFEADQTVATAQAQAEAIKIQAEAINAQGGADYVQLQAIAKWNGVLPTSFVPGSAVPFLNLK